MDTLVKPQVIGVVEQPVAAWARRRPPVLAWVLLGAALAMVPWLFMLAADLPITAQAQHWSMAWVGLDSMEAAGLACTGLLLWRRDVRYPIAAAMTAMLLIVDAWFDVATAAAGADQITAIAMALGAELPIATLLGIVAFRGQTALTATAKRP